MRRAAAFAMVVATLPLTGAAAERCTPTSADYAADARALAPLIAANYAYLDDLPGGKVPASPRLDAERDAVHDADSLLHYAEDVIASLADNHALTGRSFRDDWAIVPSYSDLWVENRAGIARIAAVRPDSPAQAAGIVAGDVLVAIDGQTPAEARDAFWARLGLPADGAMRGDYALNVVVAGRRDRPRALTIRHGSAERTVTLRSLYDWLDARQVPPPLKVTTQGGVTTIRLNNRLGDQDTIAAFDTVMAGIRPGAKIVLDLTDTPSGGTSSVARAMMGWFVTKPMPYQMHELPSEERETGIARRWVEYVMPRAGKYHPGPVSVRVGRWTGSMGEGLAVGFMALGKPVCGGRMAGLKGGVYDFDLPATGLRLKIPAERIYTVAGMPRQDVVTPAC